jgi:hypothetical protein
MAAHDRVRSARAAPGDMETYGRYGDASIDRNMPGPGDRLSCLSIRKSSGIYPDEICVATSPRVHGLGEFTAGTGHQTMRRSALRTARFSVVQAARHLAPL